MALKEKCNVWDNIHNEDKKLNFRPNLSAQRSKTKIIVVDFACKPRPFHSSRLSLILMVVFERFSLLLSDVRKLWEAVELLLNLDCGVSLTRRSPCVPTGISSLVG